jgi:hypothetical protein
MAGLLDIFGTGGQDVLGLLGGNVGQARDDAQAQALYALAGSLLSGGPTGLSIVKGLQQGQQAYKQAMRGELEDRMTQFQLQEFKRKKEEEDATKRRQAMIDAAVARAYQPGVAAQPAQEIYGEDIMGQRVGEGMTPAVVAQAPRLDLQSIAPALLTSREGRATLGDLVKAQEAMQPKLQTLKEGEQLGYYQDGKFVSVANLPKAKTFKEVDLGNVVVMLDNQGNEVMRFPKGRAPEGPTSLQTIETENGIATFNPRTGALTPVIQEGKPVMGKGAKPTAEQSSAAGYANRMVSANQIITSPEVSSAAPGAGSAIAGAVPFIGDSLKNLSQSPQTQKYAQAARDWIRAKLRKESGAAIGVAEEENEFRTYFPVVGDSAEVIKQKADARELANQGMIMSAGSAYKPIQVKPQTPTDLASMARQELERRRKGP